VCKRGDRLTCTFFEVDLEDVKRRRSMETTTLRQALLTRLGRFPERVPLNPKLGSKIDESACTRTLVTYDVEAGERVSAWLLMPQREAPPDGWPAVLAIHQHDNHYELGKAEPAGLSGNAMYAYGKEICQRGYVVLCPDLLCFEDRRASFDVLHANNALDNAGYERFEVYETPAYWFLLADKVSSRSHKLS
jgi:hypothetical protein